MHKSKKKTKSVKLPKPINIKKEKTEEDRTPHPISHYIDDRLELVKQIFGTLKPKTITNLAPDFLKKKSMDEIEELCLNELICISTKRLLSIINATKCPTDTESSGDSDVQHEEEHISLEEISSDSEIEGTSSNAAKKKSTGTGSKAKKDAKESAKKEENNGQISVLELLELQARARAIRSQLALEPVTKIEVDSDEGDNKESSKSAKDRKDRADRKRKSTEKDRETTGKPSTSGTKSTAKQIKTNGSTEAKAAINTAASTVVKETEKRREKRIKLKRNYRNNNEQAAEITTKLQEKGTPSVEPNAKEVKEVKQVKKERSSRSASPDVIPIVAEPETLFISDSSDAEEKGEKETAQAVEKIVKPKENILADGQADTDTVGVCNEAKSKMAESTMETEEGEITDTETDNGKETAEIMKGDTSLATECTDSTENVVKKSFEKGDASNETIIGVSKSINSDTESGTVEELKVTLVATVSNVDATRADKEETDKKRVTNFQDDDDQNDDIISIEGGDLESEMIEHLEDSSSKNSFATTSKEVDEHIETISLNSSEDDGESKAKPSESWHSRYLNSSKVSKVLAASRLSKRVRDKIRKSNSSKKDKIRETEEAEVPKSSKEAFISQHEDGSVEQYRELLELRQHKT